MAFCCAPSTGHMIAGRHCRGFEAIRANFEPRDSVIELRAAACSRRLARPYLALLRSPPHIYDKASAATPIRHADILGGKSRAKLVSFIRHYSRHYYLYMRCMRLLLAASLADASMPEMARARGSMILFCRQRATSGRFSATAAAPLLAFGATLVKPMGASALPRRFLLRWRRDDADGRMRR